MVEYVLVDQTAGKPPGTGAVEKILEPRSSSCCQQSLLSPCSLVLHFLTAARMFWDFGSLFWRRCGVISGQLLRHSFSRLFRRGGVLH